MKKYVATLGIALALALPHAAQAQGITPPPVPADIEVPAPNDVFLPGRGVGTRNYECQPVSSRGQAIASSPDADFVRAGAIPWLKLDVENTGFQEGPTGGVQSTHVAAELKASADRVSVVKVNVNLDPSTLWPRAGEMPATRPRIRAARFDQASGSNRSGARARSKKRIVAGAIAGSVGGFFAGGFLGAHIEGDRCDCDDPGVRGFLIGAPIGAVAGGIFGAKFLF